MRKPLLTALAIAVVTLVASYDLVAGDGRGALLIGGVFLFVLALWIIVDRINARARANKAS
jgi:hypothetical protein